MVFVSQLRACDFVCLCLMVRVTICIYMCVCLCNIYWRTSFDVPVMLLICCVASSSSSSSLIGCKRKNLLLWGEEDGQKDRGRSFVWNPWWQWPTDFVFKWKKKTNSNSKNHLTLRQLFLRGQQFVEGAHGYRAEPSYRHSCLNPLSTIRPKYYPLTFLNTCTHHSAAPPPPFLFFFAPPNEYRTWMFGLGFGDGYSGCVLGGWGGEVKSIEVEDDKYVLLFFLPPLVVGLLFF